MGNELAVRTRDAITEKDKEDLVLLQQRMNIDEDKFWKGVHYAQRIQDGLKQNAAYAEAFGVDSKIASKTSSQFHRGKWVQELIRFFRPDEETLYIGEIKTIIAQGMQIVKDPRSSNREKTEAMKALQPYIKAEKLEQINIEEMNVVQTTGESIVHTLDQKLQAIADDGKMVDENGDIIDVTPIE
jgi:hypothetical protein